MLLILWFSLKSQLSISFQFEEFFSFAVCYRNLLYFQSIIFIRNIIIKNQKKEQNINGGEFTKDNRYYERFSFLFVVVLFSIFVLFLLSVILFYTCASILKVLLIVCKVSSICYYFYDIISSNWENLHNNLHFS